VHQPFGERGEPIRGRHFDNTDVKLLDESGRALQEIVAAVHRVTDIVGRIAGASREQSAGIEQVNRAVAQTDETTQQNASLVEEAAPHRQRIVGVIRGDLSAQSICQSSTD